LSILDEVPMGRKPIETFLVGTDKRARMFGFIAKQVAMGGQAYIVLPAIEDSENMSDLQSVTTYYEEVIKPLLPDISAEILHGKWRRLWGGLPRVKCPFCAPPRLLRWGWMFPTPVL
ncbi:MAG: hypothetical protein RSA20_00865, partial [Oscillospiraceae bacterium]